MGSISRYKLKDINKLKFITKIALDSIIDKLENLVLFYDEKSKIKLKDEILEYINGNEFNKNYFSWQ